MTISKEDLEFLIPSTKPNLEMWVNQKEQIGKTLSKERWDEWNQYFEWDEVEEVVVPEQKKIKVKNLRVKENY